MATAPTKYAPMMITQKYRGYLHRGVDLRNYDFDKGEPMEIVAPEDGVILRTSYSHGKDGYGNNWLAMLTKKGLWELKFIHNDIYPAFRDPGAVVQEGDIMGISELGGNSKSIHLHFETWSAGKVKDPVIYFQDRGLDYGYKTS